MSFPVITERVTLSEPDRREIFRYAGGVDESLLDACLAEIENIGWGTVVYTILDVDVQGEECFFADRAIRSRDFAKFLSGYKKVLLFAATVGVEYDRLIMKYSRLSPVKALFFQAIGSERTEALCDAFLKRHNVCSPRFSAGYGDLSLDVQRDVFELLDPAKNIGVSLNSSLLMSPSKSVTAFVGIGEKI